MQIFYYINFICLNYMYFDQYYLVSNAWLVKNKKPFQLDNLSYWQSMVTPIKICIKKL